ncbi:DUF1540 domain-containing protein [Paenibacillus sp. IB182496]|uniref:DUF1540 domain-containing protein n=1 Tax=Paenibacillus sabuli TaxID=2772509 RepID=A0A927BYB2_9BACL|nr:DUF1540 domain-containing protein [Paenibacillus sabuli]MBD2847855.1 DUF1540 domain-containing protein [Paenibacillus sabuli]
MAKDVLCEVSSCRNWQSNNRCSADSIYIVNNSSNTAHKSAETDCKTFDPK